LNRFTSELTVRREMLSGLRRSFTIAPIIGMTSVRHTETLPSFFVNAPKQPPRLRPVPGPRPSGPVPFLLGIKTPTFFTTEDTEVVLKNFLCVLYGFYS